MGNKPFKNRLIQVLNYKTGEVHPKLYDSVYHAKQAIDRIPKDNMTYRDITPEHPEDYGKVLDAYKKKQFTKATTGVSPDTD